MDDACSKSTSMNSEPATQNQQPCLPPLTAPARQRLQKVFEHGQRCVEKKDFDYANKLLTQCVVEDPGNLVYLQHFLANLQQKYGENRRVSRLSGLKIKNQRSALGKASSRGDWPAALQAACAALTLNPWDLLTLQALASAYETLGCHECELFCLVSAIGADAKDVGVNRQAGLALERLGQFDQAIACWQRVKQVEPQDEQARQAIARLSVEQTIDQGGYDPAILSKGQDEMPAPPASVALLSKETELTTDEPPEVRLQAAIAADPTAPENYIQLADIYQHQQRFDDAQQLLSQGFNACGSGNLELRGRLEDVQMRRAAHQLAIAEQRCQQEPSTAAEQLVQHLRVHVNQIELETYAARSERDPTNLRLKYELGLRLKRAGKVKEAISALQSARSDSRREVVVLVELGECFQHLEQYKLALSHYEQACETSGNPETEIHRKALYRAAVLATGMQEWDRAERHLTTLAALDYSYRDVAERLDKIAGLRDSS